MTQLGAVTYLLRLCLVLMVVALRPSIFPPATSSGSFGTEDGCEAPKAAATDVGFVASAPSRTDQQFEAAGGDDEASCLPGPLVVGLSRRDVPIALLGLGQALVGQHARELPGFPSRLIGRHPPARAPPASSLVS